jgi:hypothetical protein
MSPLGIRGGPEFFVYPNSYFFVTKNSVQNFKTLGQPLLGEKNVAQKERRKENNHKNSGHFVPLQRISACTPLGPKNL